MPDVFSDEVWGVFVIMVAFLVFSMAMSPLLLVVMAVASVGVAAAPVMVVLMLRVIG